LHKIHILYKMLPPFFSTGDKGSFAEKTLRWRKPSIVDRVIQANNFDRSRKNALFALKDEITAGRITNPFKDPAIRIDSMEEESLSLWKREVSRYEGGSWLDIPFYFAEACFYMRILVAIGYFDSSSPFHLKDPYRPFKERELYAENGGLELGRLLAGSLKNSPVKTDLLLREKKNQLETILYYELWGNRVDLSLFSIADDSRGKTAEHESHNLLIDHSERLIELLLDSKRVDIILDNTGQELVCDLFLTWYLLTGTPDRKVHLHAKKYPFYVSDAMLKDVVETIEAFQGRKNGTLSRIGAGLTGYMEQERLVLHDHYFWNSPLGYDQLPEGITRQLMQSDIVLLKGDVNYRRMLSDRKWEISRNMEELTGFFPASFALIRTMKSESVVDIDDRNAEKLFAEDPEWRINGIRGIIRMVEKTRVQGTRHRM